MSAGALEAAVLVTGDEVLRGRIQESNAGYLARSLAERGVRTRRIMVVGDAMADLESGLRRLLDDGAGLVCTTGGLGPTHDDLTMAAVAAVAGRPLVLDREALAMVERQSGGIRRRFPASEATLRAIREKQATMPAGATVLPPIGTAPGAVVPVGGALVVVLPGPPWELRAMWEEATASAGPLRDLLARAGRPPAPVLRLEGVLESEFVEALAALPGEVAEDVGVYTKEGELEVIVGEPSAAALAAHLDEAFPGAVFSRDGRTVDEIVAGLLVERGEHLAVAESCTGGGLGQRLTVRPGASRWFRGGVISYDDDLKRGLLGVPPAIIERHGAVSAECATAMAEGARRVTGAEWGVSITGIAGPDGGTPEKPVGLVWVGVAGPAAAAAHELPRLRGDREAIRRRSITMALHRLRRALQAAPAA